MSHKGNSRCLVVVASFKRAQGRSGVSSAGWCFLGPYCSSQSLGDPAPRSLVGAGWCWLAKLKSTNKHDLELPTEAGIHFIGKLMRRSNERALEPWLKEYVSALSLQAFQAPA